MFPKHDPEMAESSLLLNITDQKYSLRRKLSKTFDRDALKQAYIFIHT